MIKKKKLRTKTCNVSKHVQCSYIVVLSLWYSFYYLLLHSIHIYSKVDAGQLDEAQTLVIQGVNILSSHNKYAEAADLGDMLIKTYTTNNTSLSDTIIDAICQVSSAFPANAAAAAVNITVLRAALKWASHAPLSSSFTALTSSSSTSSSSTSTTDNALTPQQILLAKLHVLAARACVLAGPEYYSDGQRHYLESYGSGTEFGAFLWKWSKQEGYATERDLFLARAILQLLCLGNMKDANAVRDEFLRLENQYCTENEQSSLCLESPLVHFIKFLLLTLERDAKQLYLTLVDKYTPSLNRDKVFFDYLQTIGYRYYHISPPQSGLDNMMSAMMNMFGGGGGGNGGFPAFPFPGGRM